MRMYVNQISETSAHYRQAARWVNGGLQACKRAVCGLR